MTVVGGPSSNTTVLRSPIRVRVRLRRSVLNSALLSYAAAMVPITLALGVDIAGARGRWPVLLGLELFITLCGALIVLRRRFVIAEVTDAELRGNGISSPMEAVPLERIARVHLVRTYVLGAEQPVTQLLATDAEGRRLFRMRGTYWERGDLELIASALPVRPHIVHEPIRLSEFWDTYPTSEYWFENKAIVRVLSVLGVCALAVVLAVLVA